MLSVCRSKSLAVVVLCLGLSPLLAQDAATSPEAGPYFAHILEGGPVLSKALPQGFTSTDEWTELAWVRVAQDGPATTRLTRIGDTEDDSSPTLFLREGHPGFRIGTRELISPATLTELSWHLLAVVVTQKTVTLYVDKAAVASLHEGSSKLKPVLDIAPTGKGRHFGGDIYGLTLWDRAVSPAEIDRKFVAGVPFTALQPEENAKPWPLQTSQQVGYTAPQDPATLPHGTAPEKGVAKPTAPAGPTLLPLGAGRWKLARNWKLLSNEGTGAYLPGDGVSISIAKFQEHGWLDATVPGTVLTTLVDRGIYPDPDYGLNNLAIPESLNKHDYWYRVSFSSPVFQKGTRKTIHFSGINYTAEVWLNGVRLGQIRGAFQRADFDVTALLRASGKNVLAVRILPPPHPGIPNEESIRGGPGENGGAMTIDGPTFVATEGWDWIPAMRDRDTGIWQDVLLEETGAVTIGDPQVITRLPLPDTSSADVEVNVPLENHTSQTSRVRLNVRFEGLDLNVVREIPPGSTVVHLDSLNSPGLHIEHPRLWWPNGYGKPELYHLMIEVRDSHGTSSDIRRSTFGIREISYELSLFDHTGRLRRVEVTPTDTIGKGYDAVDVRHDAIRKTDGGWAFTIDPKAESSPAVREVNNEPGMTDLVIKVNGVRIAIRGGNWGMDDSRKRVSRERLEPYFRLHRDANLNMIRNWVGQSTEEVFYDLADEYGMLVWNDFWESTQNYNAEPEDLDLFMANARDVVLRDRNHPSIALWCGRNEGVPQPILNEKLISMLHEEDGTRFYTPSSNKVNLRDSGPYAWQPPSHYFTTLDQGFAVELGVPSFPTKEAFERMLPAADRWPMSDSWAYHDWHQSGNGETRTLMEHLDRQLGKPTSLQDFERKIQMFDYVDHQAIFEGFYQHLWQPNSGRMIWMSHPAWPSTMWQMYSSDYDTQASYYAIRKANAPRHIQMDLSDYTVSVVNTTPDPQPQLTVRAIVYSPQADVLSEISGKLSASQNSTTLWRKLPLNTLFARSRLLFICLEEYAADGKPVADNFYWVAKEESDNRLLSQVPQTKVDASATIGQDVVDHGQKQKTLFVTLENRSSTPALAIKLTLLHADGRRILPIYYSDNYISLMPGEQRVISVRVPEGLIPETHLQVLLRGWNQAEIPIPIMLH